MSGLDEMRRAGRGTTPPAFAAMGPAELARIDRTSAETHARVALELWRAADALGRTVATVEAMGNGGWQAVADEADAADRVVIDGPEVARALRSLAMRLDRSVMVRAGTDD